MSTSNKKTYLLTDFGDSCIRYITVEDTKTSTSITKIKTDNSTGAAPQVGNKANAYVIHSKTILEKMKQIVELNDISEIILNLPSYADHVMVLPSRFKEGNLVKYILKEYPEIEDDSIIIAGEIQTNSQGITLVPVSAIQKEYASIIENASKLAEVKVTTSLTRLALISKGLNEKSEHVILDVGYASTRGMVFDENSIPLAIIQSSFCGRDVIDAMGTTDYKEAINKFNILQDVTEEAKARINNGAMLVSKKIKSRATPGSKVFILGGLSTLAWKRALDKAYKVEKLSCKGIEAKNKALAVTIAPTTYAGLNGFEPLNMITLSSADSNVIKAPGEQVSEDEYFKQISQPDESGFAEEARDDRYEEDDDEEVIAKPKRRKSNKAFMGDTAKQPTRRHSEPVDLEDDDSDLYEEEEEDVRPVAKKKKAEPKQKPNKDAKKAKKSSSSNPLRIIIPLIAAIAALAVICIVSYKAYINYQNNGKNVDIQVTNESRSLVDYVHMVTNEQQVLVANVQEVVEEDRHYLMLELQNTTEDIVSRLTTALEECDVEQTFAEPNDDGTSTVILKACFK